MPTEYATLRIDRDTRDRLQALAKLIDQPMTRIVELLSHGDMTTILRCTARKGEADGRRDR